MAVTAIRLLGDPVLRTRCAPVTEPTARATKALTTNLRDTLLDFRKRMGFGRGIAAPQIGVPVRMIYIDFEYSGPLINPRITRRSRKMFHLWDDCFSFPDLLVRLRRHQEITVAFTDAAGKSKTLTATGAMSELLQHEIDHLDGILSLDRAIDSKHIILRSELEKFAQEAKRTL